jgi:predicted TIM-barrel fold metal-dependent hydrolase
MLQNPKCVGVKIHPDAHGYALQDHAEEIFAFCDAHGAVLETHSGGLLSMPEVLVPFADRYPRVQVIASHLGCGDDGCIEHQVRAIQMAKHGNIFTDVSSVRSILHGIIEWAVQQVGVEKLLFGTDTPLHHIAMMKQRVEYADLTQPEKQAIFYQNAKNLLQGVFEE